MTDGEQHSDEERQQREAQTPRQDPMIGPPAVDGDGDGDGTQTPYAPTAAPGWYPTPGGGQRYWDGAAWLDIPAPPSSFPTTPTRRPLSGRTKWIIAGSAALVLLLVVGGFVWKAASDGAAATAAAEVAADLKAEEEADAKRIKDNERAAAQREAAEKQAELDLRNNSVDGIEASVKVMAEGHTTDGIIDGPIINVTCSPVDGGSLDDVAEKTTVFSCFVANKDNGDGTMSGYTYNATMNWTTGQYTYGLGEP